MDGDGKPILDLDLDARESGAALTLGQLEEGAVVQIDGFTVAMPAE